MARAVSAPSARLLLTETFAAAKNSAEDDLYDEGSARAALERLFFVKNKAAKTRTFFADRAKPSDASMRSMCSRNGLIGPKTKRFARADLSPDHSEDQHKTRSHELLKHLSVL
mgnify:CR=1 FL=1